MGRWQLLLDLDGPLLDCRDRYWYAYRVALDRAAAGTPLPLPPGAYWEAKRRRVPEAVLVRRCGVPVDLRRYHHWRQRLLESPAGLALDRVWPWVVPTLSALADRWLLYLVTLRRRRQTLLTQLARTGLRPFFHRILSRDENAGTFAVKVDLIGSCPGVLPSRAIICGDTEIDVLAGQALNLPTVAVCCGIRTRAFLQSLHPTVCLESIADLPAALPAALGRPRQGMDQGSGSGAGQGRGRLYASHPAG